MFEGMELRRWLEENYERDEIRDMYEHGCLQGFHGLISYAETNRLYNEYCDEIWDIVIENLYVTGKAELKLRDVYCHDHFTQRMVWDAVEIIAEEVLFGEPLPLKR